MSKAVVNGALACFALACVLSMTGCVGAQRADDPSLPRHEWISVSEAVATMRQRDAAVSTVSAEVDVTLDDGAGREASLEGVMAMRMPDHARVQAWKMGRTVLDLTVSGTDVWLKTNGGGGPAASQLSESQEGVSEAVRLGMDLLSGRWEGEATDAGDWLELRRAMPGGLTLTSRIDKATLTVRRCEARDAAGVLQCELVFSGYRAITANRLGEVAAMPTRIEAVRGPMRVVIGLREIEVNGELEPTAFDAPRDAMKMR